MKIGFAQINPTVGDLRGNCELIIGAYERLAAAGAELVLTPELAITGYPPQDLVFKSRFVPEIIVNLSASPFRLGAPACRFEMIAAQARTHQRPICYCNVVGGNDQLIFDGNSIAVNASGNLIAQLAAFREDAKVVDTDSTDAIEFHEGKTPEQLFAALSLGVRDYFRKCNFHSAVIGLSGGVDSAVTAVIAMDALGAENVTGVSMPSPYSSRGSIDDARALARNLGIKFFEIPITDAFRDFKAQFKEIFKGLPENETEENMQPRLRAMTLMALSNKFGHLLLTTGNKSELAVGYCTLYGDMAGGLAVISDVPKTMVYELARWINSDYSARSGAKRQIIPESTIEKAPSAELKPNQKDQDTLPPYEILDKILQLYVEENLSARDIIARGFNEKTVRWVQRRIDLNEYKREQSAPGLKVTSRAFGVGRKMPIAQRYVD